MKKKTPKKCLVIGGAGFLGSYAVESLLDAGHSVRVFDRPHADMSNLGRSLKSVDLFFGDMTNAKDIELGLRDVDYIYHFAYTTIPKSATENPIFDVETNVCGLLRILEAMRKTRRVKRLIFSSSGGVVYGVPTKLPIPEDHPTKPISAYGVSKLTCEKYLWLYRHVYGLDCFPLRLSNPYGPRQNMANPQGAIIHFLGSILRNETIEVWGDGSVVRDYFYVGDLLPLFPKLIAVKETGDVFNIGKGEGHSLNQIIEAIGKVLKIKPKVKYTLGRKIDVPANVLSTRKAKQVLGWSATTSLHDGIRATWEWLRQQPGLAKRT